MKNTLEIAVIIPVTERFDDVKDVFNAYKSGVQKTKLSYEFIYILDGPYPEVEHDLLDLKEKGEKIKIIKLAKPFGEAIALTAGFEQSSSPIILTLPAYFQVEPSEIPRLISELENKDMVVAQRWPRTEPLLGRLQTLAFHIPIKFLTNLNFDDLGCGVRAIKRRVIDEISIYGDQHRFLPLLAYRQGFKVTQLKTKQAKQDTGKHLYPMGVNLRRLLDILSIIFLFKFSNKPMRFFGLVGSSIFGLGAFILGVLATQRLFWAIPLADRPVLLLGSLLVVLGIQIFAIGLVGEIIIFTHSKDIKEYTIDKIIN
jgi:glycosyltransferase involved in cell wall biosynthesis